MRHKKMRFNFAIKKDVYYQNKALQNIEEYSVKMA